MISIIILTSNRRPQLEATLSALAEQRDAPLWNAVVLDNASTDDTAQWLRSFDSPRLKVIRLEPSHPYAEARNRAVAEADGEILVFLDDDCVPEPGWLAALAAPFAEGFDAVGGMAAPAPDHTPPPWWDARMNWIVGLTPPLPPDDPEGARIYPSTSNMAVRREWAERHPFQEIAPAAWSPENAYLFGREDAEAWRRWRLAGARTVWAPGAVVRHHFHPGRYRWEYVKARAIKDGRAFCRRRPAPEHLRKAWFDVLDFPRAAAAEFISSIVQSSRSAANADGGAPPGPSRTHPGAYPLLWACRQWGVISEASRSATDGGEGGGSGNAFDRMPGALMHYATAQAKAASRPLVRHTLQWLRPKPHPDTGPEGIALVCCGFLGDAVLIAPLALALRRQFPHSQIHLITLPNGAALYGASAGEHRLFHSIVTIPHRARRLMAPRVREAFESRDINLAVFTYCHLNDPQELLLQRARTLGWDQDAGFPRHLHYALLDRRVEKSMTTPEMRNLGALAAALGADEGLPRYEFIIPEEARDQARRLLDEAGLQPGRFVCLHPGAGYPAKQWTPDGWIEVCRELTGAMNLGCAFVGGADMREEVDHWIASQGLQAANFCGRTDIWTMGAMLAAGAALITTDSGPKHLAIALGTRTVTLYGSSDESRWGAWREPAKHAAVRGFFNRLTGDEKLGEPDNLEMRAIRPAMVIEAAETLLTD